MRQDLLNYIKSLTDTDLKSLTGRVAKLFEEGGELSKKVLPYENAFATTHRFTNKKAILEEVADCFLVLASIVYDKSIDSNFDELEEMVKIKADKWDELQRREGKVSYPIPFEIHVTVDADNSSLDGFKAACSLLGVKPILLDLETRTEPIKDLMTSSVFMGNNGEAIRELERISNGLAQYGFMVVREKIETVPWHPSAPSKEHANPQMPKGCYFECHFAIELKDGDRIKLEKRLSVLKLYGIDLHLSRNTFKSSKLDNGSRIITLMATYRSYDGIYEDFQADIDSIAKSLQDNEWNLGKVITEFSIYDTKVDHDKSWLEGN